jgi:vanillate O-demethylase ferredoxin subunit
VSDLILEVGAIRRLTPAIKAFTLRRPDGRALPALEPGAHIQLKLLLANGTAAVRAYSPVNPAPAPHHYEIAVQREAGGRGGSAYLHDRVEPGDRLRAAAPRNEFALAPDANDHLLIAGGIGITPLLAMHRALAGAGARHELHYVARAPELMAYRDEVAAPDAAGARLYFDGGDPGRGPDVAALMAAPMPGRHVYVCGPRGLIDAVIEQGRRAGWAPDHIHFELFTEAEARTGDQPIEVELRRSGRTITVPADRTVLDAVLAAGVDAMFDCRRGECGVCTTDVIEGAPEHRDYYLTDKEKAAGKQICICISRARGKRLVLDL